MQLVRGLHNLRQAHRGCVATIGNFDGVHLGHQAVFARLCAHGRQLGEPATVITFEPQPQEYFAPEAAPARLTRLREKLTAIAGDGGRSPAVLEFGARLAAMPAEEFVVGPAGRHAGHPPPRVSATTSGSGTDAGAMSSCCGRPACVTASPSIAWTRSRTRTHGSAARESARRWRRATSRRRRPASAGPSRSAAGWCTAASGARIGFPTANVHLHRRVSPVRGVFAVRVLGIDPVPLPGVANVGNRPTVDGGMPGPARGAPVRLCARRLWRARRGGVRAQDPRRAQVPVL